MDLVHEKWTATGHINMIHSKLTNQLSCDQIQGQTLMILTKHSPVDPC